MKKILFFLFTFATLIFVPHVSAQTNTAPSQETFYKAQVLEIIDQGEVESYGFINPYQTLRVKILDGDEKNKEFTIDHGKGYNLDKNQLTTVGEKVVLVKSYGPDNTPIYQITDKYRLDSVLPIIGIFFLAVILLSGWQGVGSILGMLVSLGVILKFIIPQILSGSDPLLISIIGCFGIMLVTIYLAHGFSHKTTIALIATFLTLVFIGILSSLFVKISHLSGLGSEEAYSLKFGITSIINLKGLLLGGILIGALGVLDDVTTGISASIFELAKANPNYRFPHLFRSGLAIGREHITSLVNTLVLAYAGASLPIFITLVMNPNHYPLWTMANSEFIIEEVVRTLAGSIGLVAAVPLTTFLACYYQVNFAKKRGS